jgi:hypothetical protein
MFQWICPKWPVTILTTRGLDWFDPAVEPEPRESTWIDQEARRSLPAYAVNPSPLTDRALVATCNGIRFVLAFGSGREASGEGRSDRDSQRGYASPLGARMLGKCMPVDVRADHTLAYWQQGEFVSWPAKATKE